MSKKSSAKSGAKAGGKAAAVEENAVTRPIVLANYGKLCKSIGVPVNTHVNDVIRGGPDDEGELVNFILEGEIGSLGPGGVRAFVMALLGTGPGILSGPYTHLRYVRVWNQDVGNEGAAAIATLLEQAPPSLNIAYLELLDCGVSEDGCLAIANALQSQRLPGLLTLNLDYNAELGDQAVSRLCDGLFTNTVLKKLHLDYCGIQADGAIKLAQLVAMPSSALESLSLQGNSLGNEGLLHLSLGLARSQHLSKLNLSDNGIRNDKEALTAFCDAIVRSKALAHVDITYNQIEASGAMLLLPAVAAENAKLQCFLVDATLPADIFRQLNRAPKSEGKKKGGKKKGGKKGK